MSNNVNIILFTLIAVFGYGIAVLLTRYIPFEYMPIPAGLIYISALIIAYYFLPSHGKVEGFKHNDSNLMPYYDSYHQDGYSGNNLFEVTPAKKCCLFPNEPGCENISQEEKDCVCCTSCGDVPGTSFNGRPVLFEYTPESNSNWEWTRCKEKDNQCGCASAPLTPAVL